MSDSKQTQKTIIAVGFKGSQAPQKAIDLVGGKPYHIFQTFRSIGGCTRFIAGDNPVFKGGDGQIHNPATAKDKVGKLIIADWRTDGAIIIGEI